MFLLVWRANGLDPLIGHRLPALLRTAGLVDVEVEVHGRADPVESEYSAEPHPVHRLG